MTAGRFRIFISSPSDVFPERERLDRVIARLNGEYGGGVLEAIRWERTYYSAAKSFQDQIPLPADTDLVICILWKRLGFELPPDYRRPDGTTPTGTEFEFENAIQAAQARGTPDVLVYHKAAPVLLDAERVDVERAQFELLKLFWARWFRSDTGHFKAAYQSFDTTDAFATAVEEHIRQWLARHHMGAAGVTWPVALRGSPFRGLQAFDANHSDVFFGRRRAIERAREGLGDAATRGTPFLLILGASGAGKSSLARAGLLPRIVQPGAVQGIDMWRSCVVRPSTGSDPIDALAHALHGPDALPELALGDSPTPADFAALLTAVPDAAARAVRLGLARATAALAAREQFDRPVAARLLLVIDQLEEALTEPAARDAFGRALAALVASGLVWVVATLRSDLYALFQASPPLLQLRDGGAQLDLTHPTVAELGEMIEGPAAAAGLRFDRDAHGTGLEEVLTSAADQPGALPLLQLTLDALFQARDRDANLLTFAAYDALGGLRGVIERSAEAALSALDPAAQAALPDVLRALVGLTDEGAVAARTAPADAVERTPEAQRLVAAFSEARLLVLETQGGERRLGVAHEALLSGWPRAAALIAADREALRTRGRIEAAARIWLQEGRDSDFLMPHGRFLAEAVELVAQQPHSLDTDSSAFVQASKAAELARETASRAAAARELRLTRRAVGVVLVLLLLVSGVAALAYMEQEKAQQRTAEAERNFASALGAGASLVEAADAHLADGGMSRDVAQSLLHAAEDNLGGLIEVGSGAGSKLRDTQVQLLANFSKVQLALCDSAGARARAAKAVDIAAETAAAAPSPIRGVALVQALDALGQAASAGGDRAAAKAAYRRAEQVGIAGAPAGDDAIRSVRRHLAVVVARDDRPAGLRMLRDDLAWQDQAATAHAGDQAILGLQAWDLERVAGLTLTLKQLPDAQATLDRQAAILQRLVAMQSANVEWQRAMAENARQMSRLADLRGDASTAMTQGQAAAQIAARVVARDPQNAYWQREAMNAQFNLFGLYMAARDFPPMVEAMRPALAFVETLTGPRASLACQGDAAFIFRLFGQALVLKDAAAATGAFQNSLSITQAIAKAAPDDREAQFKVLEARAWLARSYVLTPRVDAALAEYQGVLAQLQGLLADGHGNPEWADLLAQVSTEYGGYQVMLGKNTEALATQEAIRSTAARMADAQPEAAPWQHVVIVSQLEIARLRAVLHQPDEEGAALQDAVSRAERVAALPQHPEGRLADLLETRKQRGNYELMTKAPDAALTDLRAALSLADELIAAEPASPRWPTARAQVQTLLARATEMIGSPAGTPGNGAPPP